MIRINLLPVKKSRRQEAMRTELMLAGLGLVGVVLLLGAVFAFKAVQASEMSAENARIQTHINELKEVVARVEEIERLKGDLTQKLQVIKQLKASKAGPVRLLDELAQATPEKLQLTSLDEKAGLVKLAGVSVSNEVISQFLSNLEGSEFLRDVYLNAIDQKAIEGVKLKTFSITMRLVVPGTTDGDAPATDAKGGKGGKNAGGAAPTGGAAPADGAALPPTGVNAAKAAGAGATTPSTDDTKTKDATGGTAPAPAQPTAQPGQAG